MHDTTSCPMTKHVAAWHTVQPAAAAAVSSCNCMQYSASIGSTHRSVHRDQRTRSYPCASQLLICSMLAHIDLRPLMIRCVNGYTVSSRRKKNNQHYTNTHKARCHAATKACALTSNKNKALQHSRHDNQVLAVNSSPQECGACRPSA